MEGEEGKEITIHTMLFAIYYFFLIYSQTIQKNNTYTHTFMHVHLVPYPSLITYSK